MKWLAGIIILILLLVSARFRKFAWFFVLICVGIGLLFWQYQEYEENKSKNRISPAELVFKDISFKPSNGNYEMTGRIINNSEKYALNGVKLKIIVKDCANNDNTQCIVISEVDEYLYINIPSQQARDFRKDIYLYSDQSRSDDLVWNYSIEYTESK